MSKSPFYMVKIKSNNFDLSEIITSFSYEDCIEEDDLLHFTAHDILDISLIDNPAFVEGAEVIFQFGYLGYKISNVHVAVIKTIKVRYSGTTDLVVTCLDKGNDMKQTESCKIWKNLTASEIVGSILNKYGIKLSSDPTKKKYESLAQGNRTDFEFIRYLTSIEDGGSYMFYVKDFEGFFIKRDLKKGAVQVYQYKDENGERVPGVLSFEPQQSDEGDNTEKTEAETVGVDPNTGEEIYEKSNVTTIDSDGNLGTYTTNPDSKLDRQKGVEKENTTGKSVPYPAQSVEDAKNVSASAYKTGSMGELTGTLEVEGDPLVKSADIIAISGGIAKKHSGLWRSKKVVHDIGSGGYITRIELDKNASDKPLVPEEESEEVTPNKIILDDEGTLYTEGKTIPIVDQSGKEIGRTGVDKYRR